MNPSLLLIPDRYKASKLYSQIPDSGAGDLAFTRANDTATRVNSAGLIEKVRTNLVLQSQTFDTASWIPANGGTGLVPVVTANNATAPDGTNTAETIVFNSGAGTTPSDQSVIYQSITLGANPYCGSFFARVTSGTAQLMFRHATGGNYTTANLTTTWQRFSSAEATAGGTIFFEIGLRRGLNEPINSSVTAQIWGAQLETGDIATPYIPTTTAAVSVGPIANIPRIDYTGGGCGKLLLEPQRTNLVTFSEQFDNASWIKLNGAVTANIAVSPDGFTNADSFVPNTTSGVHALRSNLFNQSAAAAHSWFVKANGYSKVAVRESELVGNYASFNLTTGTLISTDQTGSIVNYGNGWYRLTLVDTTTGANAQTSIVVLPDSYTTGDPLINWSGDGTKGVLAYGCQVELGSYPTSYIPTLGASVTRSADAASKTGISSLIGQSEGTMFIDVNLDARAQFAYFTISPNLSSSTNYLGILIGSASIAFESVVGSALQAGITLSNSATGRFKIAAAYNTNDFVLYVNGSQVGTDTSGSVPACSEIGLYEFSQVPSLKYNTAAIYTTRLSNLDLASLTTL